MDNARLRSYDFKCPCCSEPHTRLFEYYQKFRGLVPEDEEISSDREVSMLERVSMKDQTVFEESRSIGMGDSVFRCGKCHEFFKFNGTDFVDPELIVGAEKEKIEQEFNPIVIVKRNAVMNSVASFVSLVEKYGCTYDEKEEALVIRDENGKEYKLPIARQLFDTFYKDNPMFNVKKSEQWAFDNENLNLQK